MVTILKSLADLLEGLCNFSKPISTVQPIAHEQDIEADRKVCNYSVQLQIIVKLSFHVI